MKYKGIIVAGAIAIGAYLLLQAKKIPFITAAQKAALRKAAAQKAALRKAAAQKIAQKVAQKVVPKRIGQPTTRAAYIAARRKAAAQKAALRKAVAQNIAQKIKIRRAVMARYAKRQRPQIQRPNPNKKQLASKLFPGAEKSRIIPYYEGSRHSYYGPKSYKLQNEGYRVASNRRYANSIEAYNNAKEMEVLMNPKLWKK